jgi:hypothetical protein
MIKKNKNPHDGSYTIFNLCDIFNRNLHDRSWPLRLGGHGVYTEPPTEHNFAFYSIILDSILENVFSLYMYMNNIFDEKNSNILDFVQILLISSCLGTQFCNDRKSEFLKH